MGEQLLSIDIRPDDDGVVVVLSGELDMVSAADLRRSVDKVRTDGHTHVVVDMADLLFMDSSGISAIVTSLEELRRQGGSLVLRNTRPPIRRLLEITRIGTLPGLTVI